MVNRTRGEGHASFVEEEKENRIITSDFRENCLCHTIVAVVIGSQSKSCHTLALHATKGNHNACRNSYSLLRLTLYMYILTVMCLLKLRTFFGLRKLSLCYAFFSQRKKNEPNKEYCPLFCDIKDDAKRFVFSLLRL